MNARENKRRGRAMPRRRSCTFALVLMFCIGAGIGAVSAQPVQEEAQALQAREQRLYEKVRSLEAEQQQLLLQKTLSSADSKYLELDLRAGEGALKYRTRVLRTFPFTSRGKKPGAGPDGPVLSLTSKVDGTYVRRKLLFDNAALVIEGKTQRGSHSGNSLFISIGRRDLAAIYYALEPGSFAYLKAH